VCSGKTNCKLKHLKSLEQLVLKSRRMWKSAMASVLISSLSFILDNTQCLIECGQDSLFCVVIMSHMRRVCWLKSHWLNLKLRTLNPQKIFLSCPIMAKCAKINWTQSWNLYHYQFWIGVSHLNISAEILLLLLCAFHVIHLNAVQTLPDLRDSCILADQE